MIKVKFTSINNRNNTVMQSNLRIETYSLCDEIFRLDVNVTYWKEQCMKSCKITEDNACFYQMLKHFSFFFFLKTLGVLFLFPFQYIV